MLRAEIGLSFSLASSEEIESEKEGNVFGVFQRYNQARDEGRGTK